MMVVIVEQMRDLYRANFGRRGWPNGHHKAMYSSKRIHSHRARAGSDNPTECQCERSESYSKRKQSPIKQEIDEEKCPSQ